MIERRKLETAAFVLPVFGAFLILPPIVHVMIAPISLFGIPFVVVYLFAVWIVLIVATAVLSPLLGAGQIEKAGDEPPRPPGEIK